MTGYQLPAGDRLEGILHEIRDYLSGWEPSSVRIKASGLLISAPASSLKSEDTGTGLRPVMS